MTYELHIPKKVYETDQLDKTLKEAVQTINSKMLFVIFSKSAMKQQQFEAFNQLNFIGTEVYYFEMPKGEPTMRMLDLAVSQFVHNQCDAVLAIGGGSAIDLAKGVAAISKNNEQKFQELANYERVDRYPIIAIPTTAGTGAEATKIAVLIDDEKGVKYNPGHPDLIPDIAILIPSLTYSLPARVTAHTGLDALTHAIEAYVSTKANDLVDPYCIQAVQFISNNLLNAFNESTNYEARKQMLLGSYYAGIAISNVSTNLAHATGRALGTKWNIPHGLSVALLHPFVVEIGYESCKERYKDIENAIGLPNGVTLVDYLMQLNDVFYIWDDAAFLLYEDFNASVDLMVANALSGNGIVTNRFIPTKEQITQLYFNLYEQLKRVHSIQS